MPQKLPICVHRAAHGAKSRRKQESAKELHSGLFLACPKTYALWAVSLLTGIASFCVTLVPSWFYDVVNVQHLARRLFLESLNSGERRDEPLPPKSGVKFVIFLQIGPKIGTCSQNLCSSRSTFTTVASAFQRFQPVNSTQYLLGLLSNEGRVD